MADDKAPAWVWKAALGLTAVATLIGLTRQDERQKAATRAIVKAEVATEKRFEGVNEFRGVLTDQQSRFVTRTELVSAIIAVVALVTLFNKLL